MIIAIEGITGIGKTTLATLISRRYDVFLIEQEFQSNPFFPADISDLSDNALERELIFLLTAYNQLKNASKSRKPVVTDFGFDRLRCFAETCLTYEELSSVYDPVFNYLRSRAPQPDYVIYLYASPSFAARNAEKRSRPGETQTTISALSDLSDRLEKVVSRTPAGKILRINVEEEPFSADGPQWDDMESRILAFAENLVFFKR